MSKYLVHRLKQLADLIFHPNFKTLDGIGRQTSLRYSEPNEIAFYENNNAWNFLEHEKLTLEEINQRKKQNILVVGCGAGREFSRLTDQNLYGLDTSEHLLQCCQKHFPQSKLATKIQDFSSLKFDIIYISHHVYNHLQGKKNRLEFLSHLATSLKPDGSIYLNIDLFKFSFFKHPKFYFWSQILRWRWKKNEMTWEKGDTVRAFNGAHNPFGRIFFYHYFADEKCAENELLELKLKVKKNNGFWLIKN